MLDKFSFEDRKLVIREIEKVQKQKLLPVGRSQKFLTDDTGNFYCVFGGREDWHGISQDLLTQVETHEKKTLLVIAKKYRTRLDVCVAAADKMIAGKEKLVRTKSGGLQFHTVLTEDGMYLEEIPELIFKKIAEIPLAVKASERYDLSEIQKIINVEIVPDSSATYDDEELTHSDLQAKIILIGNLLGHRTFTPDQSKVSRYGRLGDLCSDTKVPDETVSQRLVNTIKNIDVIWFDSDGWPTHCFEVEHTTDITKGLLRLYQTHKLRIKMFIVAKESSRSKFETEVSKSPFFKIKEQFIFRTYSELNEFLNAVKKFALAKGDFLHE